MLCEVEDLGEAFLAGFADKLVVGHTHLPTFVAGFYTRDGGATTVVERLRAPPGRRAESST
jgi:hypothetical protein